MVHSPRWTCPNTFHFATFGWKDINMKI
jgi:hypothetical protein